MTTTSNRPKPTTHEDIRSHTRIAWAPQNCQFEGIFGTECGKPATYRFGTLSPWAMTCSHYTCTEHLVPHAAALWGTGHVIQ